MTTELAAEGIPGLTHELYRKALDLFLEYAYPDGPPPRVERLLASAFPCGRLSLSSRAFEFSCDSSLSALRVRYDLRVGWIRFPHMKITVETSPDATGPLFSVNTHDRALIRPSDDPEAAQIQKLILENNVFKEHMERLWEAASVPTFKGYLRRALLARKRITPP
jgi:hypothetical protein